MPHMQNELWPDFLNQTTVNRLPIFLNVLRWWSRLRSNYWFVPTLIIAACFVLSYIMLTIDYALPAGYFVRQGWVYTRDPDGARQLLSVVSQSMITVAGVVFSVTVVALALASNQFGTRVLKSFVRDVANQVALGTLLGTFLYGILIMRRVESRHGLFVPSLSVAMAIALAIFSLLVLIYFIHHVIVEIQAENVVASVVDDLYETMDVVFPQLEKETPAPKDRLSAHEDALLAAAGVETCCRREGFVQKVNLKDLVKLAQQQGSTVRLLARPGEFVSAGTAIARVRSDSTPDEQWLQQVRHAFSIGAQRSYDEDIGLGLQQLSLIAVRSLSPAINAVGTALDATQRLFSGLMRLDTKVIPSIYHRDENGCLRLIEKEPGFEELFDAVFDPIRHAAATNPTVVAFIIRGLAGTLARIRKPRLRRIVCQQLERFAASTSEFPQEFDRARVRELYETLYERRIA